MDISEKTCTKIENTFTSEKENIEKDIEVSNTNIETPNSDLYLLLQLKFLHFPQAPPLHHLASLSFTSLVTLLLSLLASSLFLTHTELQNFKERKSEREPPQNLRSKYLLQGITITKNRRKHGDLFRKSEMIHFSPQNCEFLLPSLDLILERKLNPEAVHIVNSTQPKVQLKYTLCDYLENKKLMKHIKKAHPKSATKEISEHYDPNPNNVGTDTLNVVEIAVLLLTPTTLSSFKCFLCPNRYYIEGKWENHEPAVHNHTCTVCDEVFLTEDSLNEHVKTNHETPPKQLVIEIPSEPLNEEIFNQYVITDHEASHTTNQIGPSGKATPDVNTQQSNPTCPICAKTFLVDKDLKQQVTSSHSVDTHQCDVCDYTMAHIEKEHLKTVKVPISNLSVLCCLQCTFTAIDQPDMKVHIETPHKIFIGPHYLPENIDSSIYGRPDPSPQLKLKYDENLLPICKVKPETSGSECLSGSGSKDEKKTINANIPKDVGTFKRMKYLTSHVRTVHTVEPCSCPRCNTNSKNQRYLSQHLQRAHKTVSSTSVCLNFPTPADCLNLLPAPLPNISLLLPIPSQVEIGPHAQPDVNMPPQFSPTSPSSSLSPTTFSVSTTTATTTSSTSQYFQCGHQFKGKSVPTLCIICKQLPSSNTSIPIPLSMSSSPSLSNANASRRSPTSQHSQVMARQPESPPLSTPQSREIETFKKSFEEMQTQKQYEHYFPSSQTSPSNQTHHVQPPHHQPADAQQAQFPEPQSPCVRPPPLVQPHLRAQQQQWLTKHVQLSPPSLSAAPQHQFQLSQSNEKEPQAIDKHIQKYDKGKAKKVKCECKPARNEQNEAKGYTVARQKDCEKASDYEQPEVVGDKEFDEEEALGIVIKNSLMESQSLYTTKEPRLIQEDLGILDDHENCDTIDIVNDLSGGLLVGSDVGEYYMSDFVDAQLRVDTCMTDKIGKLSNISEAKKTGMEEESITTRDNKSKTLDDEETLMLVMSRSDDDEETKETSVRETDMFAQVLPAIDSQITQFRADFSISKELKIKDSVEGLDNEKLETGEESVTESQEVFGKAPAGKSRYSEESVKPIAVEDLT
jgi:hypothetical protein